MELNDMYLLNYTMAIFIEHLITVATNFTVNINVLMGFKDKHISKVVSIDIQILKFQGYWSLIGQEYHYSYEFLIKTFGYKLI